MIASAKPSQPQDVLAWHRQFLAMVPAITTYASFHFRKTACEAREELIQEVLANCLVAFDRLVKTGKADLAYPSVLARYAVGQMRRGRRVGLQLNHCDVTSPYAQWRQGFVVERLEEQDAISGSWQAIIIEDRRATPADTAACRIDFQDWLGRLTGQQRRIAKLLATGEKASVAAKRFHLTNGRISQLRKELQASWEAFQAQANCAASRRAS